MPQTTIRWWFIEPASDYRATRSICQERFATRALAISTFTGELRDLLSSNADYFATTQYLSRDPDIKWPRPPTPELPAGCPRHTKPERVMRCGSPSIEVGDGTIRVVYSVEVCHFLKWKQTLRTVQDGVTLTGEKRHEVQLTEWQGLRRSKGFDSLGVFGERTEFVTVGTSFYVSSERQTIHHEGDLTLADLEVTSA